MPGLIISTGMILTHLIFTTTSGEKYYRYPHFTGEETPKSACFMENELLAPILESASPSVLMIIYSFNKHLIEHLLGARHCSRLQGYCTEWDSPWCPGAYILVERTTVKKEINSRNELNLFFVKGIYWKCLLGPHWMNGPAQNSDPGREHVIDWAWVMCLSVMWLPELLISFLFIRLSPEELRKFPQKDIRRVR